MSDPRKVHVPRVRIIEPPQDAHGFVSSVLTTVLVDGELWPVTNCKLEWGWGEKSNHSRVVTLTFLADVTVERPGEK